MSFSTLRVTVGRVILVAGVLVLLFIPYLLWGTGLITAHAQTELRQQFEAAQQQHRSDVQLHATPHRNEAPEIAPTIVAPAPGQPVGIISIPKISLDMAIVEGTDAEQLRSGPGHYPGTPLPGEQGNVAIAGHRTTYLHPFYDLNELVPGDDIDILTVQGLFEYQVVSSQAVAPTDVAVVAPTPTAMLTLTTCNPRYSASQRLVVQAKLTADVLGGVPAPAKPASTTRIHATASDAPVSGNRWTAIGLGLAVAALTITVWILTTKLRGGRRIAVAAGGTIVWLGVVFLFFSALAPLLPASY